MFASNGKRGSAFGLFKESPFGHFKIDYHLSEINTPCQCNTLWRIIFCQCNNVSSTWNKNCCFFIWNCSEKRRCHRRDYWDESYIRSFSLRCLVTLHCKVHSKITFADIVLRPLANQRDYSPKNTRKPNGLWS